MAQACWINKGTPRFLRGLSNKAYAGLLLF